MQKILSVFIDESGDFGKYAANAPYYLITMIFHDQSHSICREMDTLSEHLRNQGFLRHSLHTAPLIRKEGVYATLDIEERRKIFNSFITFTRKINISYKTFILKKSPKDNSTIMSIKLSQLIQSYLISNRKDWDKYEKIVVYYDNGQTQLTHIIQAVFNDSRALFRTVKPYNYRLFQVADLITTLELINLKYNDSNNSKSEITFFKSMRDFKKNYYKTIVRKQAPDN